MGTRVRITLLWLLLLSASGAHAEVTAVEWTAPGECPDRAALMAELGRLLGESLLHSARFTADAQVTPDPEHGFTLQLHFSTDQGSGTRRFLASDCRQILHLAAFSIALAIDPRLRAETIAPPESTNPEPEPPARTAPNAQTDPHPLTPASSTVALAPTSSWATPIPATHDAARVHSPKARDGLWLGAQFVSDTALLPRPAAGVSVWSHKSWRHQTLRLGIGAEWFFPRSEVLSTGAGGEFSLWMLELRGCYGGGAQLQLALCPALASGQETGEGVGVDGARTQRSWFFAPGLAVLGVARPSERWIATLDAQALFPIPRDEFVVSDGPIHRLPAVSLQIAVGLGVLAY